MKNFSRLNLGTIELTTGRLSATDPSYDKKVWCRYDMHDVKKGTWNVAVEISDEGAWGDRIAKVIIQHKDAKNVCPEYIENIGVDTGLAGFFEDKPDYDDDWNDVCDYLREDYPTKMIVDKSSPFKCVGVCTSSGFGDGGYDLNIAKDEKGMIVYAEIVFIGEDDDDEDGYEDYYDDEYNDYYDEPDYDEEEED